MIEEAAKLWGSTPDKLHLNDPDFLATMHLSAVTVASANVQTKAVRCGAQLSFDVPDNAKAAAISEGLGMDYGHGVQFFYGAGKVTNIPDGLLDGSGRSVSIVFGIQPTADGSDNALSIEDPRPLEIATIWAGFAHASKAHPPSTAASDQGSAQTPQ